MSIEVIRERVGSPIYVLMIHNDDSPKDAEGEILACFVSREEAYIASVQHSPKDDWVSEPVAAGSRVVQSWRSSRRYERLWIEKHEVLGATIMSLDQAVMLRDLFEGSTGLCYVHTGRAYVQVCEELCQLGFATAVRDDVGQDNERAVYSISQKGGGTYKNIAASLETMLAKGAK